MYILNLVTAIKRMAIKELKDFRHENYFGEIRFPKENNYC